MAANLYAEPRVRLLVNAVGMRCVVEIAEEAQPQLAHSQPKRSSATDVRQHDAVALLPVHPDPYAPVLEVGLVIRRQVGVVGMETEATAL